MKCPKCGYIGFEPTDRCRNCGYDFSLAVRTPDEDLALRRAEPTGPLGDFELGAGKPGSATPPGRSRRKQDPAADPGVPPAVADLPLFGDAQGEALPIVPAASPTPPLAVRRAAPPVSRARPRATPRSVEPQPDLGFAGEDASDLVAAAPREEEAATASLVPPVAARAMAGALDAFMLAVVDLVVLYFTLRICRLPAGEWRILPVVPLFTFLALLNAGYLAMLTVAGGQTLGKMACGIKVVASEAGRLTVARVLVRTAVLLLCALPAGLGLLVVAFDGGRRGIHDRVSGTRVVRASS